MTEADIMILQRRVQTAVRCAVALTCTLAGVAAYYLSQDEVKVSRKKGKKSKTKQVPVEGIETPGGEDTTVDEKPLEDYIIKTLSSHNPTEDSEKMQQMAQMMQMQAVMAVLTKAQTEEFQRRQMSIMQATNPNQQAKMMGDLTEWVQSVMTQEQKEQIEVEMLKNVEKYQLQKAEEELQKAYEPQKRSLSSLTILTF